MQDNQDRREKKESKMRRMLRSGCIAEFYTLSGYFVKVYPCFPIDKVKFAFVEKGKKGAGFDVYVGTTEFMFLCEEILNGVMARKIAADGGEYPNAWKYVTGENASKELVIGKSKKGGIVIQGRDKANKKNAFVPVLTYEGLKSMAKLYWMIAGLMPVSRYYADLVAIYDEGIVELAQKFKDQYAAALEEEYEEIPEGQGSETDAPVQAEAPVEEHEFHTTAPVARSASGDYEVNVASATDNRGVVLHFGKDAIGRMKEGYFDKFIAAAQAKSVTFKARCRRINGNGFDFVEF